MQSNSDVQGASSYIEIKDDFSEILSTLATFKTNITALQNRVRGLEKKVTKGVKKFKTESERSTIYI